MATLQPTGAGETADSTWPRDRDGQRAKRGRILKTDGEFTLANTSDDAQDALEPA